MLCAMTTGCVVLVELIPLPEQRSFVLALLREVIPEIHRGPGCELYALYEKTDGNLVLIEKWASRHAWQAHFDWKPIKRLKKELAERVELPVSRREMYSR